MKLSHKWLEDFLNTKIDRDALARGLTAVGLEVESVQDNAQLLKGVLVAKILTRNPHPDAERLSLCEVEIPGQKLQIVCGAKNMQAGDYVALATIGTVLPGGLEIKKSKIRGVESFGMLCSEVELGLATTSNGIMLLPKDVHVGDDFAKALSLDDVIYEINITPNRGDCLSVLGVAREWAAIGEIALSLNPAPKLNASFAHPVKISIKANDQCARYSSRVLKNIKVCPAPTWVQKRLAAMGIRPINQIVDATNYVMLELGHPAHAFDLGKISESITIRPSLANEKIRTLDEQDVVLQVDDLVIADARGAIAIAGVIGGAATAINEATQDILLEVAAFNPQSVRKTAKRIGIASESSYRFERFVDPTSVVQALDRLAELIIAWSANNDAIKVSEPSDVYPSPKQPSHVTLRPKRVSSLLGMDLNYANLIPKMQKLGFVFNQQGSDYQVSIPPFRSDVSREVDVIEELIRHVGYDAVPVTYPAIALDQLHIVNKDILQEIKNFLVAQGFNEIINYSFTSETLLNTYKTNDHFIRLANPISNDMAIMRTQLLPQLIQTLVYNLRHGEKNAHLFELRNVYQQNNDQIIQSTHLAIAAAGASLPKHFSVKEQVIDFYWIKGLLVTLFEGVLGESFRIKQSNINWLHPKRQVVLEWRGKDLGFLGQVHPKLAKSQDILPETILCEISVDELKLIKSRTSMMKQLSSFPAIRRDLNLIVEETVTHAEVEAVIKKSKTAFLSDLIIYDVYRGDPVPRGKKALTYSIEYISSERTLTDEEINQVHSGLVEQLKNSVGASLRSA